MIKKNKGFTLIELLAVIVITGVLALLVMPKISNLVLETRMKIYVQDAKKMVSQAQYRMGTNNVNIEKPEIGECIVFSLKYLSVNDFRNAPNDGKYMDESSFVVVRNYEGEYQYAVLLIEHRKDGLYQGVEFVTEEALNENNAIKHVKFFDQKDIRYINDGTMSDTPGRKLLDTSYINEGLRKSKSISGLEWVDEDYDPTMYNTAQKNNDYLNDASTPRFTARVTSKNSGGTGILDTVLTVSATDDDDELKDLTVCTRVTDKEDSKYPSPEKTPELCEPYGDLEYYAKDINFRDYGLNYEDNVTGYVYITVVDPAGHAVRKLREYNIHINEGPEIKMMEITKRDNDPAAMPLSKLRVEIVDDIDQSKDLEVCFQQDSTPGPTCNGVYYNYDHYFAGGNVYYYQFKDAYGVPYTIPDGSTHNLTMYVRDKEGKVSYETVRYQFYRNLTPEVTDIQLIPLKIRKGGVVVGNDIKYHFSMKISDDLSNSMKIHIKIGDVEMTYQQYLEEYLANPNRTPFTTPGVRDGNTRQIVVRVWDEYQTPTTGFEYVGYIDDVYDEQPPTPSSFTITGVENVCYDRYHCLKDNNKTGSYTVKFGINIKADLLSNSEIRSKLKICVSEKKSDCEYKSANYGNFMSYDAFLNLRYTFQSPKETLYDDRDQRKIYVNVVDPNNPVDNEQAYASSNGYTYEIYYNKAPEFQRGYYTITASEDVATDVVLIDATEVKVTDDFNDFKLSLCYRSVTDGTGYVCTAERTLDVFKQQFNGIETFQFKGENGKPFASLRGQVIESYLIAKDAKGREARTAPVTYTMYDKANPVIQNAELGSLDSYNSSRMAVSFRVKDIEDTYTFCLKEIIDDQVPVCEDKDYMENPDTGEAFSGSRDEEGKYTDYSVRFDAVEDFGWDPDYHEENPHKKFLFSVKDSTGLTAEQDLVLNYDYYESCKKPPFNNETYEDEKQSDDAEISTESCAGRCYNYLNSTNVVNMFAPNKLEVKYNRTFTGKDTFADHVTCTRNTEVKKNCADIECFDNNDIDKNNDDTIYIALDIKEPEVTRRMETGHTVEKEYYRDKECPRLIEDSANFDNKTTQIFSKIDKRCEDYENNYCRLYALDSCDVDAPNFEQCQSEKRATCQEIYNKICGKYGYLGIEESLTLENVDCKTTPDYDIKTYCEADDPVEEFTGYCWKNVPYCETAEELQNFLSNGSVQNTSMQQDFAEECSAEEYNNGTCGTDTVVPLNNMYYDNSCTAESIVNGTCSVTKALNSNKDSNSVQVGQQSENRPPDCPDSYKILSGVCVPYCDSSFSEDDILKRKCMIDNLTDAIAFEGSHCSTKHSCYKIHDCTMSLQEFPEEIDCHGVFYQYKRLPSTPGTVLLQKVENKLFCPEVLQNYPDDYTYHAEDGNNYVLFNPNTIKNYTKIVGEDDE